MNLQFATNAGKAGLASAVQHSLIETPCWESAAKSYMHRYCETHATVFPETVWRGYAGMGHQEPAELRAYGHITKHAKRQGWLSAEPCGTELRVLGHGSYGPVWSSLIYKGAA